MNTPRQSARRLAHHAAAALLVAAVFLPVAASAEWTHWRGPYQNGTSPATGLVDTWSKDGTNLIWRNDFVGRSTTIVVDGRVCAIGRRGEGITRQEAVGCWNAEDGRQLWERRFNVYHTSVPWNRVGWASMAADPETGYLYAQGVNGRFTTFDAEGNIVWEYLLGEDLGRFSGYGGRTNTPVVDEDRVIIHLINSGWGRGFGPGGDRFMAFDKKTGDILWVTEHLARPKDLNTYSSPVIAMVNGRRLMIAGGCGGWIHAIEARTGREIWRFHLSQRGINSSVVVEGNTVFASHSEENIDQGTMGRVVAIDATGTGDVTKTHELWRSEISAGYASPMFRNGTLYVVDNSANLIAVDAKTGEKIWEHNFGTVGKASPVWADGKLFLTEVNGNVRIAKIGEHGVETEGSEHGDPVVVLDDEHLEMPDGRYAEIYASPAIAYGRFFFTTEEGIYAVGDTDAPFKVEPGPRRKLDDPPASANAEAAWVQVVPAVITTAAGESYPLSARLYDAKGRFLREAENVEWQSTGAVSLADGAASFSADKISGSAATGTITAKVGDLTGTAIYRVAGDMPWSEDFEGVAVDARPDGWLGIGVKAKVIDLDGNKVLQGFKPAGGAPRMNAFLGLSSQSGYTLQADVMGTQKGRRRSDVGVFNSGYILDMQGNYQRLQIRSWASELRMMQQMDFPWEPDVWYTMKLRVDPGQGDKMVTVRGKVWKKGDTEPEDWTFEVNDPLPIRNGSPGLYAFTPTDAYFDNVQVTK